MSSIVLSLACIALVGLPLSVAAQEGETSSSDGAGEASQAKSQDAKFKKRVSRAKQFYSNDQYEKAFEQFQKAYEIKESANLLFNMGLVNERMGNLEQALEYYEEFVVSPGIKLEMRKKAQERISVLEKIVDKSGQTSSDEPSKEIPEEESPDELAKAKQTDGEETDESQKENASTPPPSRGISTRRKIAFTTLGIGAVSLITGGVFAVLGENARQNFEGRITPSGRRRASQAAFRNILIADIALGTGLVLGTTGLVLWTTGDSAESNASRARLAPRVGTDRAALELSIDF